MARLRLYVEIFLQLVIGYSLVIYFIELETSALNDEGEGHPFFMWSEKAVAAIFTVEYLGRWALAKKKRFYPFTPMALVDLLAILPFYMGFLVDMRSLRLVRTLRVLRIFKVYRYSAAMRSLLTTYGKIRYELYVLAGAILLVVIVSGTIVYEAERDTQPDKFARYSDGLWWSVVTLTTVGYGDVYPVTLTGRLAAGVTLLVGLGTFASFISLVGGAFMSTLQEQGRQKELRISQRTACHIGEVLGMLGRPMNEDEANRLIDTALDVLYLREKAWTSAASLPQEALTKRGLAPRGQPLPHEEG
jgi:voltage-gated potassium channel